jgi:hypothetical protein
VALQENDPAAHPEDVGSIRLVREILSGGAEDDPHAWRVNFPVGGGQADVPYELHLHIRENRVVGEIAPRRIEDAFAPGLGLTDERAKYVKILMRMALHGSLKRLNRCIACGEFTLKKRSRKHSYCSKACEREYDSELKRPNEIERKLMKLSQESRYELEHSDSWPRKSQPEKLEAISQMRFRDRTYRG